MGRTLAGSSGSPHHSRASSTCGRCPRRAGRGAHATPARASARPPIWPRCSSRTDRSSRSPRSAPPPTPCSAFVAVGRRAARRDDQGARSTCAGRVAAGKVTTLGLQAKVVLAVSAAGGNPRTFGGSEPRERDPHHARLRRPVRRQPWCSTTRWRCSPSSPPGRAARQARRQLARWPPSARTAGGPTTSPTILDRRRRHCSRRLERLLHLGLEHHELRRAGAGGDRRHRLERRSRSRSSTRCATRCTTAGATPPRSSPPTRTRPALVLQAYAAAGGRCRAEGSRRCAISSTRRAARSPTRWNGAVKGDPDVGATIGAVPGLLAQGRSRSHGSTAAPRARRRAAAREAMMRRRSGRRGWG